MCTIISSRLIFGNYIIELVKNNNYHFSLEDFYRFDEKLTPMLNKIDCYYYFDEEVLWDFVDSNPFVIKSDMDDLSIICNLGKEKLLFLLNRYFRIGISKDVANAFEDASKEYWETYI